MSYDPVTKGRVLKGECDGASREWIACDVADRSFVPAFALRGRGCTVPKSALYDIRTKRLCVCTRLCSAIIRRRASDSQYNPSRLISLNFLVNRSP